MAALALLLISIPAWPAGPETAESSLQLSRPARPWEFLSAVGQCAALFGNEAGHMEAWVYPLKIFRDFHLLFLIDGEAIPAETLARTVVVRPESSTIVYSGDTFTIHETLFVPVHESGAVIQFTVDASRPIEIEAAFRPDFQLEWPAGLGGADVDWDERLNAFSFDAQQNAQEYTAFLGSPTARNPVTDYQTNYSDSYEDSVRLGFTRAGHDTKLLVLAGSVKGRADAIATYQRLLNNHDDLLRDSAAYYRNYLAQTVNLELPDAQLQQAYDWSRISMAQGLVDNPFLGSGLVAGYRGSGDGARPGFAWFFGRDSFWTSFALDSAGDFQTARTAIDFISRFQRDDGKVPHEISQTTSLIPWFTDYPFAYASADATPLYIIAVDEYVRESGDVAFAKEKWESVWKAYQFLISTYDSDGFARNAGVGHGWVEGGPLLPVRTELYQAGLGAEALRATSDLAHLVGQEDTSKQLAQAFDQQDQKLNRTFWSPDKNIFAFGLDRSGNRVDKGTVLAAVPMWFGLLDEDDSEKMIAQLANSDYETDWGMRILSSGSPDYNGGGYHFGAVWPLFTGWASVGEYRYHRALPAFSDLRANALLALDGSLGHVTEVLSGDSYQPLSTASPQQIWSAAMVASPLLRGLLGIEVDAPNHTVTFAPHVPADWTNFTVRNLHVGASTALNLTYRKTAAGIDLEVMRVAASGAADAGDPITIDFRPAISPIAKVTAATLNGHAVAFRVLANDGDDPGGNDAIGPAITQSELAGADLKESGTVAKKPEGKTAKLSDIVDQHVRVRVPVSAASASLRIHVLDDFGLSISSTLPALGGMSKGLRVISQTWAPGRDSMKLELAGVAGADYDLGVWDAADVASVQGADLLKKRAAEATLRVRFPSGQAGSYSHQTITLVFSTKGEHRKTHKH